MAFLRVLLIILLIYLAYRLISRALFPFLYQNNRQQKDSGKSTKQEGEVTIDYVEKKKKKKRNDDDGDYIEFEEVE